MALGVKAVPITSDRKGAAVRLKAIKV